MKYHLSRSFVWNVEYNLWTAVVHRCFTCCLFIVCCPPPTTFGCYLKISIRNNIANTTNRIFISNHHIVEYFMVSRSKVRHSDVFKVCALDNGKLVQVSNALFFRKLTYFWNAIVDWNSSLGIFLYWQNGNKWVREMLKLHGRYRKKKLEKRNLKSHHLNKIKYEPIVFRAIITFKFNSGHKNSYAKFSKTCIHFISTERVIAWRLLSWVVCF